MSNTKNISTCSTPIIFDLNKWAKEAKAAGMRYALGDDIVLKLPAKKPLYEIPVIELLLN